jgi:hypothetical protein
VARALDAYTEAWEAAYSLRAQGSPTDGAREAVSAAGQALREALRRTGAEPKPRGGPPQRLWLPRGDWATGGQATAPWIRASWLDDAWGDGVEYVRVPKRVPK